MSEYPAANSPGLIFLNRKESNLHHIWTVRVVKHNHHVVVYNEDLGAPNKKLRTTLLNLPASSICGM